MTRPTTLLLLPVLSMLLSIAFPSRVLAPTKLDRAVQLSDNVIWGQIIAQRSIVSDASASQPSRQFTAVTIDGNSLFNGHQLRAEILFETGLPSSDAPCIGANLVVFFAWNGKIAQGIEGNLPIPGADARVSTKQVQGMQFVQGSGPGRLVERDLDLDTFEQCVAMSFLERRR
ncbi:MAG: hypothetical protein ACI841_003862 [Planctomycetota bacterium]|jgi:hypothetical protein